MLRRRDNRTAWAAWVGSLAGALDAAQDCRAAGDAAAAHRPLYSFLQRSPTAVAATYAQPPSALLPEFQLVFCGTGCAAPSKIRNSAGILYRVGGSSLLLDAGEGCYGGLLRRFGEQGCAAVLGSLGCVWISHMHADHHAGVLRLLSLATACRPVADPLLVVGPAALGPILAAHSAVEPVACRFCTCRSEPRPCSMGLQLRSSLWRIPTAAVG